MWIVAWQRLILTLPNLQPSLLVLGLNIAVEIRGHHSYQGAGPSWLPEHSRYQTIFSPHLAIVKRVMGVTPIRVLGLSGTLNILVTRLSSRLIS